MARRAAWDMLNVPALPLSGNVARLASVDRGELRRLRGYSAPKITTAAIIPTNSRPQTTRKAGSKRPGNCGHLRGITIETTSEKPAKTSTARPRPSLCADERAKSGTSKSGTSRN